jgi:heat shock protein HslJ
LSGADGLSITKLTSTKQACADDAMTLEDQYVAALGQVATYELSGDRLTLRDSNGSTQVTYSFAS